MVILNFLFSHYVLSLFCLQVIWFCSWLRLCLSSDKLSPLKASQSSNNKRNCGPTREPPWEQCATVSSISASFCLYRDNHHCHHAFSTRAVSTNIRQHCYKTSPPGVLWWLSGKSAVVSLLFPCLISAKDTTCFTESPSHISCFFFLVTIPQSGLSSVGKRTGLLTTLRN